jgi:hypothetical protein
MNAAPDEQEGRTLTWWRILSALAGVNIVLWIVTFFVVDTSKPFVPAQLALSGVYTAVCAFRSFWPRIDLERTVLWDTPLSSVFLGRSAATVAEVSFAVQIALFVDEVADRSGLPVLRALCVPIVAALTTAQVCCWSSVITLSHLGHAIEESLWAITFAVVGISLGVATPHLDGPWQVVTAVGAVSAGLYVAFMVLVDVPMYVRRWKRSVAAGERRLGVVEGARDALQRREATRSWSVWRPEVAWLTGYFTCAVWLSLGLVHLPR